MDQVVKRLILGNALAFAFVACGQSDRPGARPSDSVAGASGDMAGRAGTAGSGGSARAGSAGAGAGGTATAGTGGESNAGGESDAARGGESNEAGADGSSVAGAGGTGEGAEGGSGGASAFGGKGGSIPIGGRPGGGSCGVTGRVEQVSACEFAITEPPSGGLDPTLVAVALNSQLIPYGNCSDVPGGWTFDFGAEPLIVLCPDACEILTANLKAVLTVSFGCDGRVE